MTTRLGECYRVVKPVNLAPVLGILDRLQFIGVNQGGTDTSRYPCFVVLQDKFPAELKTFIESLELGGEIARSVLRKLMPRQSIPPHIDDWMPREADWHRYQAPITSHPDIVMGWPDDGVRVHLEPGFLYEVRYDRTHEVINNADCERIHLQIDQVA